MDFRKRYLYNAKEDLLGKGGFSRVYRATDVLLEREVALKVFNPEQSAQYDLITEIRKVIKFQQENLCRYYDVAILETVNAFGEEEQVQVGVMEYLDGGELKGYLKNHPKYLNKLLCDVLRGLSYLHKRSIIHRDLKPQNILIRIEEEEPIAKITDFGISKAIGASQENASALIGTVEYMAPEQFNPAKYGINGQISIHLDLWSFGIMVYELIVGENLFGSRAKGASAEIVMSNILHEEFAQKVALLPKPYDEVVTQCLQKAAGQRAASAEVLLQILNTHVTDSSHFAGLSNKVALPAFNDETVLFPGNISSGLLDTSDVETQVISYHVPREEKEELKEVPPAAVIPAPVVKPVEKIPVKDIPSPPEKVAATVKPVEKEQKAEALAPVSITPVVEPTLNAPVQEIPVKEIPAKVVPVPEVKEVTATPKAEAPVVTRESPPEREPLPEKESFPEEKVAEEINPAVEKTPAAVLSKIIEEPVQTIVKEIPATVEKEVQQKNNKARKKSTEAPVLTDSNVAPAVPVPLQEEIKKSAPEAEKMAVVPPVAPQPEKQKTLNDSLASQARELQTGSYDAVPVVGRNLPAPGKNPKTGMYITLCSVAVLVLVVGLVFFLKGGNSAPEVKQAVTSATPVPEAKVTEVKEENKVAQTAVAASSLAKTVSNQVFYAGSDKEYTYSGKLKNDLPEGKGVQKFADGTLYNGSFSKGLYTGKGSLTWADGDKYVGNWSAGKKTSGTFYYKDGSLYKGTFKNELKHGTGKYMFKDGSYYEGAFKNDKFNGQGKMFKVDGEAIEAGVYQEGVLQ